MNCVLVSGLGFGDEGKGSLIDFLTRTEPMLQTVVRYNGGAQCAHNVVLKDGRHHTFSQFGSGTFAGARTHLSRFMLVNPIALLSEAKHLEEVGVSDPLRLLTIDGGALLTTPFHVAANRLKEMYRDKGRHGSCGMGIGETMRIHLEKSSIAPHVVDMARPKLLEGLLHELRKVLLAETDKIRTELPRTPEVVKELQILEDPDVVNDCLARYRDLFPRLILVGSNYFNDHILKLEGTVLFEGAQGVLLDQDYGFHPYTTWTDIRFQNAFELLKDFDGPIRKIGVLRGYATRHGAGPFVTEDRDIFRHDHHNGWGPWQQHFKVGYFDAVASKYALDVIGGVDELAITNLDRVPGSAYKVCVNYHTADGVVNLEVSPKPDLVAQERVTDTLMKAMPSYENFYSQESFLMAIEQKLGVPIRICSFGPTAEDKRVRT